jgi:hypothetical protein
VWPDGNAQMLVIEPEALSAAHLRCSIVRFPSKCNDRFAKDTAACRHPALFDISTVEFSVGSNVSQPSLVLRQNGQMKDELKRQTLRRRPDEPKLEVGDVVENNDGVVGIVLARFNPSGERRNEVHYIVELRAEKETP